MPFLKLEAPLCPRVQQRCGISLRALRGGTPTQNSRSVYLDMLEIVVECYGQFTAM